MYPWSHTPGSNLLERFYCTHVIWCTFREYVHHPYLQMDLSPTSALHISPIDPSTSRWAHKATKAQGYVLPGLPPFSAVHFRHSNGATKQDARAISEHVATSRSTLHRATVNTGISLAVELLDTVLTDANTGRMRRITGYYSAPVHNASQLLPELLCPLQLCGSTQITTRLTNKSPHA